MMPSALRAQATINVDESSVAEARASSSAAEKLKQALDQLRKLRAFEDEPAHVSGWIAQHADGEEQGSGG